MVIVQRRVQLVSDTEKTNHTLDELRLFSAWVLLGEPGAGKTQSFIDEAAACHGLRLTIAEFIYDEVDDNWKDKTLFLDGLDEVRASNDKRILFKLHSRLKQLGNPRFRIACRAADWFGESDKSSISGVSPDGKLLIFNLLPLSENDVLKLLQHNFGVSKPQDFINQAKAHAIDSFLTNPYMLELLAKDWTEHSWPNTRSEVFEMACRKQAKEPNKFHRDQSRNNPTSEEIILDAAGYLFSVMLLSDKSGVALDTTSAGNRYPELSVYAPPNVKEASDALHRMIFVPSASREERMEASHRSIAEYLAARWLAKQIDQYGLPLGRILNLLLGFDQKTVAGLRGLYAWLALHSQKARQGLIEKDPVTVILYGDVKPMPLENKRQLLQGLKKEFEHRASLIWELSRTEWMSTLYDDGLRGEFGQVLSYQPQDDASQAYVIFILQIVRNQKLPSDLITQINAIASNAVWPNSVRAEALKTWLRQKTSDQEALNFLEKIHSGEIQDFNDQLAGLLLMNLYPRFIAPQVLLRYLHRPKELNTINEYVRFWGYELPKIADESHLPILLDQLGSRTDLDLSDGDLNNHLHHMVGALIVRTIGVHGDLITDERLYSWLSIGANPYGENKRDKEVQDFLEAWLSQRPERYKGILGLCFQQCANSDDPIRCLFNKPQFLVDTLPPSDIGLWHFQEMWHTDNEQLVKEHLKEAMRTLMIQKGNQGLTYEMILEWVGSDSIRYRWLEPHIYYPISEEHQSLINSRSRYENQAKEHRLERTKNLFREMNRIKTGETHPALLYELAGIWLGFYIDAGGQSPLERFKNYCENYEEVYEAAKAGFRACILRKDLPSTKEIIDLNLNQREHLLRRPCLTGMELRWESDRDEIGLLDAQILKRMICFKLTDGAKAPDWFGYLVEHKPALVADDLFEYASKALAAKKDLIDGIHQLAHESQFQQVAMVAVPKLLKSFPLRIKSSQLQYLKALLNAGLRYAMPEMLQLIDQKIALKSVDVSQKVYWLTAGMLISPEKYEQALWSYVGRKWQRANSVSNFLRNWPNELPLDYNLNAQTLGKLIELLAPHAEMEGQGLLTEAMQLGYQIRTLISKLVMLNTQESLKEMDRLGSLPSLMKIKFNLENARHELLQRMREEKFLFPPLADVAQILSNKSPVNSADLAALVLSYLEDIATEIRTSNSDLYRQFWKEKPNNSDNKSLNKSHKDEMSCRDALLALLRRSLDQVELDCQPEADYFNDKRADIRISYKNKFELPIEIKGEWNAELWTSINDQLIERYTREKNTGGYGIYVVLWFGGSLQHPRSNDGGKKPVSPDELKDRLSAMIPKDLQTCIYVCVIDVSWPSA